MIIDLQRFLDEERPFWDELAAHLERLQRDPYRQMAIEEACRLQYLYERASTDLARLAQFSSETAVRGYLEGVVAQAFGEIHETRAKGARLRPLRWFCRTFPATVRRHVNALYLVVLVTLAGMAFGGAAVALDPAAKSALLPFPHLLQDPSQRVAQEEEVTSEDRLAGAKGQFSAYLMTHNTRVAIWTLALGMTFGVGSVIVLLYNGVILGAVVVDYCLSGQGVFLVGWLLPHGSVEIPAILIAGQASLLLAGALIGWQDRLPLRSRLRLVGSDLTTLIGGAAVMLVWAGVIEAFFSQYHEPILPYWFKTAFGVVQVTALVAFLGFAGRQDSPSANRGGKEQD